MIILEYMLWMPILRLLGIKRLKELAEQGRVTLNYTTKKELSDYPYLDSTDLEKFYLKEYQLSLWLE